jgi:hypothetical protein
MRIHANIWHLIGRLNQTAADGFLPLRAILPIEGAVLFELYRKEEKSDSLPLKGLRPLSMKESKQVYSRPSYESCH